MGHKVRGGPIIQLASIVAFLLFMCFGRPGLGRESPAKGDPVQLALFAVVLLLVIGGYLNLLVVPESPWTEP